MAPLLTRLLGRRVLIELDLERPGPCARVDPSHIDQALMNLAVNARDAMPRGGKLTIQTYAVTSAEVRKIGSDILPVADYTALSVTDTGTGIQQELLTKIFDPFFTTKDEGMGLGLSLCRTVVEQHGGTLRFAPQQPHGTVFFFTLPAAETAATL